MINIEDIQEHINKLEKHIESYELSYLLNIELFQGKQIKKIFHLADIHIRKTHQRYEEYESVFNKTYSEIKKSGTENSLIVLCGDILHEKKGYSKESIKLTFNLFNSLSILAPVIVIMGNHDGLIDNSSNYDQLDVLINQVNLSEGNKHNIYYFKHSGVYRINNIDFGVTSCYDKKIINSARIKQSENLKIALFHGSVLGSKYSNDYLSTKYDKTVDFFDGFDFVLLGDIHKFQYLNEEKTIAYPGSLIQQHIGEDINNHGFIEWDLESKNSKFIEINNDYGFAKITFTKNIPDKIISLPTNISLTVTLIDSQKSVVTDKLDEYTKDCENVSYIWKEEKKKEEYQDVKPELMTEDNKNILLKKYCLSIGESEEEAELMVSINNNFNKQIKESKSENSNVICWKLIQLKFENMFSYGSGNVINFSNYFSNEIVGIIGPNHYGKSSIIDILLFILFDRCSRKIKKQEIMNVNKNKMFCECIIESNGTFYKIVKTSSKTKKSLTSTICIHKSKKNNINNNPLCSKFIWDSALNIEHVSDATSQIEEIVGTYSSFIKCNICLQDGENFIHMKGSDKIEYLEQITSLDIFSDLEDLAKNRKKELIIINKTLEKQKGTKTPYELNTRLKNLNIALEKEKKDKEISSNKLTNINSTIDSLKSAKYKISSESKFTIEDITKKIENKNNYLDNLRNEHVRLESSIFTTDISIILKKKESNDSIITELNNKCFALQSKLMPINNNIISKNHVNNDIDKIEKINKNNNVKITNNLRKIQELKSLIKEVTVIEFDKKTYNIKINEYEIERIKASNLKQELKNNEKIVSEFKEFKYDKKCEYCINNPFTKNAELSKNKLNSTREKFSVQLLLIKELRKNLEIMKTKKIKYKKTKIQNNTNQELLNKIEYMSNFNKNIENEININNKEIKILINKLLEYDTSKDNISNNLSVTSEICEIKKEIKKYSSENEEYISQCKIISKLSELKNNILIEEKNLDKLKTELSTANIISENKKIDEKIILTEEKKLTLVKISKDTEKKISNYEVNIHSLKTEIDKRNKIEEEINKNSSELNNICKYLQLISKKGLPLDLLKNVIIKLENCANEYLETITSFKVKIKSNISLNKRTTSAKTSIEIYKINDKTNLNIASCSGFEKFIIGLVIRLSLIDVCNKHKPNFIAIDEGFSCMDENNLSNVKNLLQMLKQKFDFTILISHIDVMKDYCDKYIHINKKTEISDSYVC